MTLQHHPARAASRRPGFSLLEIMIAIMIMGLGMVMVATVFPVSLGMARDTVRSDMALVVADAAIATLRARVPVKDPTLVPPDDEDPASYAHAILAPNMGYFLDKANRPDQIIDSNNTIMNAFSVLPSTAPPWTGAWTDWSAIDTWELTFPSPLYTGIVEQPGRVFTELSGWAAHYPSAHINVAYVVPAQNIRNDDQLVVEIPPVPVPSGSAPPLFPRLHLADRVYPAPLNYNTQNGYYTDAVSGYRIDPLTGDWVQLNNPNTINEENYLMHLLAEGNPVNSPEYRPPTYYSWTAIHCHCPNGYGTTGSSEKNVLVAIVVTHRLSVNSRYARQREHITAPNNDEVYDVIFDLSDNAHINELLQPGPDENPDTDLIFPVPWLVMLNEVNLAEGEITCTAEVARLLPRGSFFIVAFSENQEELCAGTPHQVLDSVWDPDDLTVPASLKIAPKAAATTVLENLAVWVFPPPIMGGDRTQPASIQFGPRSPVIGVALEVLTW